MRASMVAIGSADDLRSRLAAEDGEFSVRAEGHLLVEVLQGAPPNEVVDLFDLMRAMFPHHLHFRAYHRRVEYAWYGTHGVVVRLGSDGEYTLRPPGEGDGEWPVCPRCEEIMHEGRVLYRTLIPAWEG